MYLLYIHNIKVVTEDEKRSGANSLTVTFLLKLYTHTYTHKRTHRNTNRLLALKLILC